MKMHPGTINFNARLEEAQRIHKENMILASRLDAMQPYYKRKDLTPRETPFRREKDAKRKKKISPRAGGPKFPEIDEEARGTIRMKRGKAMKAKKTEREFKNVDTTKSPTDHNPFKVLLEYTKVQSGKILDVAVIKEPMQDRFVIFGIDVDIGQRYELRLTSDEISSILDGDILVTHLDNIEVWVVLLNKVTLPQVDAFSRFPTGFLTNQAFNSEGSEPQREDLSSVGAEMGSGIDKSEEVSNVPQVEVMNLEPRPPSSPPSAVGISRLAIRSRGRLVNANQVEKEAQTVAVSQKPQVPALELSALQVESPPSRKSRTGGDLNVKADTVRESKRASPIGNWDFASAEDAPVIVKTSISSKKGSSVVGSSTARAKSEAQNVNKSHNIKGSITARSPLEKKLIIGAGRRQTKDGSTGGSKNVRGKERGKVTMCQKKLIQDAITSLAKRVVGRVMDSAVSKYKKGKVKSGNRGQILGPGRGGGRS